MHAQKVGPALPLPLIIDQNTRALTALRADPMAQKYPPYLVSSAREAVKLLKQTDIPLSAVFIDPVLGSPGGLNVIRSCHHYRPALPIFILQDRGSRQVFSEPELKRLALHGSIEKPVSYKDLLGQIPYQSQELEYLLSKALSEGMSDEGKTQEAGYLPVPISNFLPGTKSFFDVFVKVGDGHFVKLLQTGDAFTAERLVSYLNKGVTHFFLARTSQERCLAYCDMLAMRLLANAEISVSVKVSEVMNQGSDCLEAIKKEGLSEAHLAVSAKFLTEVSQLIDQVQKAGPQEFQEFLSSTAIHEHGSATAAIAALVTLPLHIDSRDYVSVLGLAAFLHDIGLNGMPVEFEDEDPDEIDPKLLRVFHTHPQIGADMVKKISSIDSAVSVAIAQHHMRKDGNGFPSNVKPNDIGFVSEIVGISQEYSRLLKKQRLDGGSNALQKMIADILPGYSAGIQKAFRQVFIEGR